MFLRRFSKLVCFSTLFLIFAGGMVKSTNSGLSVPDWPLSYGTLFPPMVGGVFYEHGHRMIAGLVGFMTLCLAISLAYLEKRRWVKFLGFAALGAVVLQGVLGGLTVLFFLPDSISIAHGMLAQTFFILTIIIAYSCSIERKKREQEGEGEFSVLAVRINTILILLVYTQLLIGAIMRHTEAGLAIPDFPTMGGQWIPAFNDQMLAWINARRFEMNLDPVVIGQVMIHFLHRVFAVVLFIGVCIASVVNLKQKSANNLTRNTIILLNSLMIVQILLGIGTVLSAKEPWMTSLHVVNGAAILGVSVLLLLRTAPLTWKTFKDIV